MKTQYYALPVRAASRVVLMMLGAVIGCGGPSSADYASLRLVDISGTVTLDGQPLTDVAVQFIDVDQTYCTGVTDRSGRYTLMLDSRKSGIIPGDKTVRISSRVPASADAVVGEENPDAKLKGSDKVPACYNIHSNLKIKVTQSDSAMDFDLKSDCSTTTFK